jgi:HTH-type transcriptional regulator/antitoxin HigA
MATETQVFSDLPIPPGELLAETLETANLTQAELARRMGRPVQAINEIIRGTKEITAGTAIQLERVVGVSAHIWLGLEAEYQHTKARREDRQRLEAEAKLAARFPCGAMRRLGWLKKVRDRVSQVEALLDFFGVSTLEAVAEAEAAAYRLSKSRRGQPEALAAWLRKGALDGQRIKTEPFNEQRLLDLLPELRSLTRAQPETFEPRVKRELAACGVALVLLPHLPKTHAHGATRWVAPDKAVVQLSLRGKWADIFWFTLFHELGHVLRHGRRDVFIEWLDGAQNALEQEADAFASDVLIPRAAYDAFLRRCPTLSTAAVRAFADQQSIAPGIVVGRLQHDGHVPYTDLNALRKRYTWRPTAA